MKYFLHDTSSFDDEKIAELFINFGYEGLGLFYTVLEKLGKQEKPIKTDVLKSQLRVGKRLEKCWLFMEKIGILSSTNGETFNKQLLNFSETIDKKRKKTAKRVTQYRETQSDTNNVTQSKRDSNALNSTVHNITEEEEEKEEKKTSPPPPKIDQSIFSKMLMEDEVMKTEIQKNSKKPVTQESIEDFQSHLSIEGRQHTSYPDFRSHYRNWLIKKPPDYHKQQGREHNQHYKKIE